MVSRPYKNLFFLLISLCSVYSGHSQATYPGCTYHFYKGSYAPVGDGLITLQSLAVGPDGSTYMGCVNGTHYMIIKLDSLGDTIRCQSYITANQGGFGKTILDYDGNLFSITSNDYVLRTDTAGNILSSLKLFFINDIGGAYLNCTDMQMLANGNKLFLFNSTLGGLGAELVVVTSPDASTVLWSNYFSVYGNPQATILAAGNKIIVGFAYESLYSFYTPSGSGILELDGSTGNILHQTWFSQVLGFQHICGYNTGYIVTGSNPGASFGVANSFYIRTDTLLNVIAANSFPNYASGLYGFPYIFQPQPDGSVYGFASTVASSSMTLFFISPNDVIQWGSSLFGFYQDPVAMVLEPSGIYIGTDYSATDVATGGPISGIQLYKTDYSGYFPSCTNPQPGSMTMTPLPLSPTNPIIEPADTTDIAASGYTAQEVAGPAISPYICSAASSCNTIQVTGNTSICTGSGTFTATPNPGCLTSVTWAVTGGPDTATILPTAGNAVSISFHATGAYMVKGLLATTCGNYGDSLLVHVSMGTTLSLGNDTLLCAGDSLLLRPGSGYSSYSWQDGSSDSNFLVTAPGQYGVTVSDYCGDTYNSSINVSFLPATVSPFPSSVTKCLSDTLELLLPQGFSSFSLVPPAAGAGLSNDSIQFFNEDTYIYHLQEKDSHGCSVPSAVTVQVYPQPLLFIGDDTTLCPGDSIRMDAGINFSSYQWNTGSQAQAIWAAANGIYRVQAVTANGCILRDSLMLAVYPAPVVRLDPDTSLCAGTTRQLSAGPGFASYLWNNGSTAPSLSVSDTGRYWVTVTDGQGCMGADTAAIRSIAPLPANFLPADTTLCQYGQLTLIPAGDYVSYKWNDSSTASSLTVQSPGLYSVQVTDKNGCMGTDSILLTGRQCLVGFYIPNAFTPDGGANDVFRPLLFGNVVSYSFSIFNRWGQKVYESAQVRSGWDGRVGGVPQAAGAFVWYCVYQLQGQEKQLQKGTFLLIR